MRSIVPAGLMLAFSMKAFASFACIPVELDSLEKSIETCMGGKQEKRNLCIVENFTCADTETNSSGLSSDVKFAGLISIHKDQFFVDQNYYHYREIKFDQSPGKEYQVGFGYHFTFRQQDSKESLSGIVQTIATQFNIDAPKTLAFVGIAGLDPINENGNAIYKALTGSTSQATVENYLTTYSKVDGIFSSIYSGILANDTTMTSAVSICPQLIAVRYEYPKDPRIARDPIDLTAEAENVASQIEQVLCAPNASARRANGVFVYAFSSSNLSITPSAEVQTSSDATASLGISGEKDRIYLKYARRRFFARMDDQDLHTEYYANGSKGSIGTGSLLGALFSINGTSDKISNNGYAFGYPACMGASPVGSSVSSNIPLIQLQSLSALYNLFNSNMNQIDNWANGNGTGCNTTKGDLGSGALLSR